MIRFRDVIEFVLFEASILKMGFTFRLRPFNCPKSASFRDDSFSKIDNRIRNYKHKPISTSIIQLMNFTDYYHSNQ